MTAPRRVPTEVERAAAAVEAGHAWRHTANSRPGYATWPHTAPGSPSWWRHDLIGVLTSDGRMYAPADVQLVYPAATPVPPRRRWWHRFTRRNR